MKHYTKGNKCLDCGNPVTTRALRCKSCSNKGRNNPRWKGGLIKTSGKKGIYRTSVYAPDNEMSDSRGYCLRSRLVLAEKLGRNLEPEEVVHHLDGDKTNDTPNNLRLFENESQHQRFHSRRRRSDKFLRAFIDLPKDRISRAMSFAPSGLPSER